MRHEILQGGASVARMAHNHEAVGSIPTPATKIWKLCGGAESRSVVRDMIGVLTSGIAELAIEDLWSQSSVWPARYEISAERRIG